MNHTQTTNERPRGADSPQKGKTMSVYDDVALLQQQMTEAQAAITALQTTVAGMGATALAENTDLNSLTTAGVYYIPNSATSATILNKPLNNTHTAAIEVIASGGDGQLFQRMTYANKTANTQYVRHYYSSGWGDWNEANNYDSGWLDLPLAAGISAYSDAQKPRYRRIGNEVFLSGVLTGITATNSTVATLPSDCRPTHKKILPCASVGVMFAKYSIETNGEIVFNRSTIEPVAAENWHSIACSFSI